MVLQRKALLLCALGLSLAYGGRYVDRYRELQDVNMEEEVGELGHEQAVITAEEKDSTTAKATSSVHVPHKDAVTADHLTVKVEDNWSEEDIKVLEGFNKNVTTNAASSAEGADQGLDGDQEYEPAPELTEEELEQQKIDEENQKLEEGFEDYAALDTEAETAKLQEKEMAKNKKKAEIHLLEPRGRVSENRGSNNTAPCGGTEKGKLHYMASSGSRNYIQWKTLKANKNSLCTVKLSSGSELAPDFKVLKPKDGSANREGKFPCGRSAGFEGKEFRFPSDVFCSNCILSFTQEISDDELIHQCADLIIYETLSATDSLAAMKAQREGCGGVCENGGQCRNGECACRDGFEGQFCEEEEESVAAELVWFFIISVILVLAAFIYLRANEINKRIMDKMGRRAQAAEERDNLVAGNNGTSSQR